MKRGPKSASELATIVVGAGPSMPPAPPAELSDAQATVWRAVVGSMPGNWLKRSAYAVLVEYCRHVCRARLLEMQIAHFEPEWLKAEGGLERLDKLLNMADRETRAMTACARALRLTPQAQMHPRTAGRRLADQSEGPRPWDFQGRENGE